MIYVANVAAFVVIITLQYSGALFALTGYTDWQFYALVISGLDVSDGHFGGILQFFARAFGDASIVVWHATVSVYAWYVLSKTQTQLVNARRWCALVLSVNPFIYVLLAGVFKEALLLYPLVQIIAFGRGAAHRCRPRIRAALPFLTASVVVLLIRPHLFPLVIFAATRSVAFTVATLPLPFFFSALIGQEPFAVIGASVDEIEGLSLHDMPTRPPTSLSDLVYTPLNIATMLVYWVFSSSHVIRVAGLVQFAALLCDHLRRRKSCLPGATNTIWFLFSYIAVYAMVASNSGTSARIVSFACLLYLIAGLRESRPRNQSV
ncbi:hypothetical protein WG922_11555 [Ramlibacter sp. AN1015]|uniref:hypothetical protein n=1 Tax=Ramlibacter sp. AN1015 TaxID=3133428 RepID=UPI0030C38091